MALAPHPSPLPKEREPVTTHRVRPFVGCTRHVLNPIVRRSNPPGCERSERAGWETRSTGFCYPPRASSSPLIWNASTLAWARRYRNSVRSSPAISAALPCEMSPWLYHWIATAWRMSRANSAGECPQRCEHIVGHFDRDGRHESLPWSKPKTIPLMRLGFLLGHWAVPAELKRG